MNNFGNHTFNSQLLKWYKWRICEILLSCFFRNFKFV